MIDLRSDICAGPTDEMWNAMRAARIGWATAGEDENVTRLESRGAELLGQQAAVFVPTCTMANIAALLTLAETGDAVVLEHSAHILANEGDGITSLAGLEPVPIVGIAGRVDPAAVATAIERSAATLLCLENTHTRWCGTVLDPAATEALAQVAHEFGARVHLDGARLANAAVALGVPLHTLAAPVDTVVLSLNKGLCAPFGALLAGDATVIAEARVQLKRLGGGTVHNAGIAAAAGLVALDCMIDRLAEDHRRATELARLLAANGVRLNPERVETNIVNAVLGGEAEAPIARLAESGVLALTLDGQRVRFVTHRLIGDDDVEQAAYAIAEALAAAR